MDAAAVEGHVAAPALSDAEREVLQRLIDDPATPRRRAIRARIVLDAATGDTNRAIAQRVGVSIPTVALWRKRYAQLGIDGLGDLPRTGRPRSPATSRRQVDGSGADVAGDGAPGTTTHDDLDRLLEAAARTIARRGFAATRVSDVAAEAGVSPATVHYHFKVKQEILVQALLWANERLVTELEAAFATTEDPVARLAMLIERSVPYPGVQRDEYLLEIDLWSQVRLHRNLLPAWERYGERWMGNVTAMIEAGIASGDFTTALEAEEVAERLVAMTDGLSAQSAIGSERMSPERVRDLVLRFTAEQLAVDVDRLAKAASVPGLSSLRRSS